MERLVVWTGEDAWRAEVAAVDLGGDGIRATGTQIGADPVPYRLDYRLDAGEGFVTRRLEVEAAGEGWKRWLRLTHDGRGGWDCETGEDGASPFGPPGGDVAPLAGALDCDLGLSPLTNMMPVQRSGLDRRAGAADFLMAWVASPELTLHAYPQRYEHLRAGAEGSIVRFIDLGLDPGFESELELDEDGLVLVYPLLARRLT